MPLNWGGGFNQSKGQNNTQQQQARPQSNQGLQWGAAYKGGGGNQNRFAALGGHQDNQFQQQTNRTRPQEHEGPGDWRQIVASDVREERPQWPYTSYSHIKARPGQKGGANDFEGDFSFEEVRWAQMQAAAQGVPAHTLSQELQVARSAQDKQWQALNQARQPPSLGGPQIPSLASLLPTTHSAIAYSNQPRLPIHTSGLAVPVPSGPGMPATPFGQVVGAFGRFPSVAATATTPFTQPASQAPSAGFSSQAGFGSAFNSPGGTPMPSQQLPSTVSNRVEDVPENERVWVQDAFEKGKIPDTAPPQIYCQ